MFRSRAVSLALVGLFLWTTACTTSYKQIDIGELPDHDRVRVTRTDGERETLLDPVVVNDAISGREDKARRSNDPIVPLVIPLEQVRKLESVDLNTGTNIATVLIGGILVLTTFSFIVMSD